MSHVVATLVPSPTVGHEAPHDADPAVTSRLVAAAIPPLPSEVRRAAPAGR